MNDGKDKDLLVMIKKIIEYEIFNDKEKVKIIAALTRIRLEEEL